MITIPLRGFSLFFSLQLYTVCQSACNDSETCSMLGNFPRMQPKMSPQGAKQQERERRKKKGCALYPHLHPSPFYARNFLCPPSPSRVISTFLSCLHIKHWTLIWKSQRKKTSQSLLHLTDSLHIRYERYPISLTAGKVAPRLADPTRSRLRW